VVLEVTAKTESGIAIPMGRKTYWEVGLDLDGDHRLGAWQIKEIVDLALPPRKTTAERFIAELPEGTKSAEIEVKVTAFPAPDTGIPLHRIVKTITF
jgi:hypothetical protein